MRKLAAVACVALSLVLGSRAGAADKVRLLQGGQANGRLTSITPDKLVLESGSNKKTIPVNEVDLVQFDSEPRELTEARVAVHAGRFDEALKHLTKLDAEDAKRAEIAADIEYYRGLTSARLALAGNAVTVIDMGAHLAAIKASGLKLEWHDGKVEIAKVKAVSTTAEAGKQDLVVLAVKAHHLDHIAKDIDPLLDAETMGAPTSTRSLTVRWRSLLEASAARATVPAKRPAGSACGNWLAVMGQERQTADPRSA